MFGLSVANSHDAIYRCVCVCERERVCVCVCVCVLFIYLSDEPGGKNDCNVVNKTLAITTDIEPWPT